jgi:hypothetical protein
MSRVDRWAIAVPPGSMQVSTRKGIGTVSQGNVERVVGRLATDESFRRRFWRERAETIADLVASGCELNPCERQALAALSQESVEAFAAALDPRIQKTDLCSGEHRRESGTKAGFSSRRVR